MAAKGTLSKEIITKKILETFPGSFTIDKVIRIPMSEDGSIVQIKVALTAAKDVLEPDGSAPDEAVEFSDASDFNAMNPPVYDKSYEPTAEEKANVEMMLKSLGL